MAHAAILCSGAYIVSVFGLIVVLWIISLCADKHRMHTHIQCLCETDDAALGIEHPRELCKCTRSGEHQCPQMPVHVHVKEILMREVCRLLFLSITKNTSCLVLLLIQWLEYSVSALKQLCRSGFLTYVVTCLFQVSNANAHIFYKHRFPLVQISTCCTF